MIEYRDHITREMIKREPNALFVFGDNLVKKGFGGQAKEMRGEPNSVGLATKKYPSMSHSSFLTDEDFEIWGRATNCEWLRLFNHRGVIVWPANGIGTGLARLDRTAPLIYRVIQICQDALK